MKIAVIRQECSFRKGGAERYAANLCRELVEMGHQVWVLAEAFEPSIHPDLVHVPVGVNHITSASRSNSFHRNSQQALAGLDVDAVLALSRSHPSHAFRVSDPLHRFWMKIRYPGKLHRFLQTLNPRHRAILNLGNAHMGLEEAEAAAERFRAAAEATSDRQQQARAYHNLGNALLGMQQPGPAVEAYKQALRRVPSDEDTRYNLALAQRLLEEQEQQQDQDQDSEDQQDDDEQDGDGDGDKDQDGDGDEEQDQEQDGDQDGEPDQDTEQEQQQPQDGDGKDEREQQPQEQRVEGISPEDAQRLLDALERQEREVQEKVMEKLRPAERKPGEKDW